MSDILCQKPSLPLQTHFIGHKLKLMCALENQWFNKYKETLLYNVNAKAMMVFGIKYLTSNAGICFIIVFYTTIIGYYILATLYSTPNIATIPNSDDDEYVISYIFYVTFCILVQKTICVYSSFRFITGQLHLIKDQQKYHVSNIDRFYWIMKTIRAMTASL